MYKLKDRRGNVLTELAIVLPIVFLIGIGILDITRAISAQKIAVTLSREISNYAFYSCHRCDLGDNTALQNQTNTMRNFANGIVPGTAVRIAVYYSNSTVAAVSPAGTASRFTRADFNGLLGPVGAPPPDAHDIIVVGEVYVPFTPILPLLGALVPSFAGNMIYEATIL